MKGGTFKGGTHPFGGKDLSKDLPVKKIKPSGEVVYPVSQHIGAPSNPIVQVGDQIKVGQTIAEAGGFVSTDICSSVSGTVKKIEPRLTVSGAMVNAIVVENDDKYETVDGFGEDRDYSKLSKDEIRDIIKKAGIVGMGGAGFPTHVKLAPKDDNAIDYVLVNGAECEPYLTSDYRMMIECPEMIVGGLKVILSLFPNAKGYICIEDNKPEAIEKMQEAVKGVDKVEVKVLKTKYPQGAERTLIYASTGRTINSKMLPADAGCVVNNIDTVISIYNAVCKNIPLIRRIVTVTGEGALHPQNFEVPTGMNYAEVLEAAGGCSEDTVKIVSGGPMMGMALFDLNVPVMKSSSALLCMTKDEVAEHEPSPCIRCGRCVSVCPSKLVPQKMLEYAERFDNEGFEKIFGMECYECGSCTYVCPAKRRLTQSFKETRRSVLDARRR
ncbi:MAG: electron transport complex subunit RsxC [Lachnospiraceae bacterium]|jgi:electron transport complex protein RnfC|nr:electron transport complex subunit RsxC [Lachnospiraceae bacterium]